MSPVEATLVSPPLQLRNYQKDAVNSLSGAHRLLISPPGVGKTACALTWAARQALMTGKTKVVVWTTASVAHSGQWFDERDMWAPTLQDMEVVSWHMAKKWVDKRTPKEMSKYIFIADEVAYAKHGVSSLRGRAFLMLTKYTEDWIGLTGTPGDNWMDFYAYFQASGLVKNKTAFQNEYCIMQRYPFPRVLGYNHTELLEKMWQDITVIPDTSAVEAELPEQTHQVVYLPAPKGYKKVQQSSKKLDGTLIESDMELLHYLRQMCDCPAKAEWVADFLETIPHEPLVIFYNYTCERDTLLAIAEKAHRRIWRIDGECHEIPKPDTIGENDIVLCHYLSGAEGLNLQFISRWVSYSYNYSYSTTIQAMGRIRRLGQSHPQFYYQLRCNDTVEVEIAKALSHKQDFAEDQWKGGNM